jgi:hypothetical protein
MRTGTVLSAAASRLQYPAASSNRPFLPLRKKVERNSRDEQRNRKMDQHHMLGMFRLESRLNIEGVQHLGTIIGRRSFPSSSSESSKSTDTFPLWRT